jgi:septal ring factor EnvC (AmiA/AmiB activator)
MTLRTTGRHIVAVAVAVGLGWGGGPVLAQVRGAKDNPKQELNELNRLLEQKRRQEQAAEKREKSVLDELEGLDYRVHLNRRQIVLLDRQISEQSRALEALSREVEELGQGIDQLRRSVGARLKAMYMSGDQGGWAVLLGAGSYEDLIVRTEALQRIAAREAEVMAQYRTRQAALMAKQHTYRDLAEELGRSRSALTSALTDIDSSKSKKHTLLAKIRTELEESTRQLQELLKRLDRETKERNGGGRLAQAKGRLPWPQDGDVVGLFGRQRHPLYNTDIFRRGIEIKVDPGKPVRAVHQAVVAYADWFKGYGLVVVLDHGDHYYTLYAHLGKVSVKVGEAVAQGHVIGDVGETGLGEEHTLYFELRHHGTPMDPLLWLKKRG